jgi:hypothetical protein
MARKKKLTPRPEYSVSVSRFPIAKFRWEKGSGFNMGSSTRRSYARNEANTMTPPTRGTATAGFDHPRRGCSINANTTPPSPSAQRSAPT